jgi:hypothetical protein
MSAEFPPPDFPSPLRTQHTAANEPSLPRSPLERIKTYLEALEALPSAQRAAFVTLVSAQDPHCAAELASLATMLHGPQLPRKLSF